MKKLVIVILVIAAASVVVGAGLIGYNHFFAEKTPERTTYSGGGGGSYVPAPQFVYGVADEQDYSNFEQVLRNSPMIQALPNSGKLLLSFYNFYTGERVWERSYILTKGSAEQGSIDDYDIKIIMHSKYLTVLENSNLCPVIKTAQKNGDFGTETAISKVSLLWKYKGMMDYKDCLGL